GAASAIVDLARDRLDVHASFSHEQDAAIDLSGATDEFLGADDRHGSTNELEGNGGGLDQPGGSRGGEDHRIGHDSLPVLITTRWIQLRHVTDSSQRSGPQRTLRLQTTLTDLI